MKVFSFHRQANSVGQIIGPIAAGTLAYFFGWPTPFILFAVAPPSSSCSLRLREPVRGVHERLAAGMDEEAAQVPEAPEGIRSTMVTPARVRTIRRGGWRSRSSGSP